MSPSININNPCVSHTCRPQPSGEGKASAPQGGRHASGVRGKDQKKGGHEILAANAETECKPARGASATVQTQTNPVPVRTPVSSPTPVRRHDGRLPCAKNNLRAHAHKPKPEASTRNGVERGSITPTTADRYPASSPSCSRLKRSTWNSVHMLRPRTRRHVKGQVRVCS